MKFKVPLPGITCWVLSHGFSLGVGIYDGVNDKNTSLWYPFVANVVGTSLAYQVMDSALEKEEQASTLDNILAGSLMGGITSPIEYGLGKVIGMSVRYFNN